MSNIKAKTFFSIVISKALLNFSKKFLGRGTNFPGKVAIKIDCDILSEVSKGYKTILVTGTNGKTTTCSMIYNMLLADGKKAITNNTGANLFSGITSTFIHNYSFRKNHDNVYAVIEVDEANLKLLTKYITPEIITITNLFRDQLDRYGEVYTTLSKIMEGVEMVPSSILLLNGDEPLLGKLTVDNKKYYYGFNCGVSKLNTPDINAESKFCINCKSPYKYNSISYGHLGDYYCEKCGYKRPYLNYTIDKIIEKNEDGSLVIINGAEYYINQGGIYNVYNALCAYGIAGIMGLKSSSVHSTLKSIRSSFGRQESIIINNKKVKIILVKNPTGFDQAIDSVNVNVNDKSNLCLSFLLNDNYADGRDVSWIWDTKIENISIDTSNEYLVCGIRAYDMAVRLKVAGVDTERLKICSDYEELLYQIENCESSKVYIFATYTAMLSLRKFLQSKTYIKNKW